MRDEEGLKIEAPRRQTAYLRRIRETYPELEVDAFTLQSRSGQFNDALVVNEELIFRFPKTPQARRTLATETALLRALRGRLPLPVPYPTYSGPGPSTGEPDFMGYGMIPGEALSKEALEAFEVGEIEAVAVRLAEFLRRLHALPVAELGVELPLRDDAAFWRRMYAAFRYELFEHMRPDAREMVVRRFESFLGEPSNFAWRPVLRHGDFGGTNILYDPSSRSVSGVIDFGSAARGDPAVDLAAVAYYGEGFLEAFYPAYPALSSGPVRERAAFYQSTHALQQALWASRAGDQEGFEDGISAYA